MTASLILTAPTWTGRVMAVLAVQLYRHAFELANALEEVANGVAFLMSDEASYITGFNLEITGGQ